MSRKAKKAKALIFLVAASRGSRSYRVGGIRKLWGKRVFGLLATLGQFTPTT